VFAVEVRSTDDYGPAAEKCMAAKRADYFTAGTLVVWDVDVLREKLVRLYRASDPVSPTIYRAEEIAGLQGICVSTVRTHIKSVREKTGANSVREIVHRLARMPQVVSALRINVRD